MSPATVLGFAAGTTAILAVVLAVTKLLHREVLRWRGLRSARYVAAIGELLATGVVPRAPVAGWASDPLFHDALADFRLVLTGDDRDGVDRLAGHLGIGDVLERRIRRRFVPGGRLRALTSLADLAGPEHTDLFRGLVDDRSVFVRVNAIRGLARLEDVESVRAILDRLSASGPWEAARIVDALVEMGLAAVAPTTRWLDDVAGGSRSEAGVAATIRILGLIGSMDGEPAVLRLATTGSTDRRLAAVSALGRIGTSRSYAFLREALAADEWSIRARAAVSAGALSLPDSSEELARLLRDPVWWVRQNAAEALCSVRGGPEALVDALDGDDDYAADAAMHALATSGLLSDAIARSSAGEADEVQARLAARVGA